MKTLITFIIGTFLFLSVNCFAGALQGYLSVHKDNIGYYGGEHTPDSIIVYFNKIFINLKDVGRLTSNKIENKNFIDKALKEGDVLFFRHFYKLSEGETFRYIDYDVNSNEIDKGTYKNLHGRNGWTAIPDQNIHIISIGVNTIKEGEYCGNCVNDANSFINEIKWPEGESPKVIPYLLTEENATKENILKTLKNIVLNSSSNDYFVFYYAGFMYGGGSQYINPYGSSIGGKFDIVKDELISLSDLSSLIEQIKAKKQLIIIDSGTDGEELSRNVINSFIEANPLISTLTERQRFIITGTGVAMDNSSCGDRDNGPMMNYLLNGKSPIEIFYSKNEYEFSLMQAQVKCPLTNSKYLKITDEEDYRSVITKNLPSINRGSMANAVEPENTSNKERKGKTYAFIVATNEYNKNQTSWGDLGNPINDANAITKVLKEKYNVDSIIELRNPTKKEVLESLMKLKNKLIKEDRLLFFIAGHGYYNEVIDVGSFVFTDAATLNELDNSEGYLSMAELNGMLDKFPSKQVLVLIDVCFGTSFAPNAKDINPNSYLGKLDIPIDELIERKNEYKTRIFLASGKGEVPDYWSNSLQHSPFANKIIKELNNEKEFLSPGRLFMALEGNATESYLKEFGSHEIRGDFLLKVKN